MPDVLLPMLMWGAVGCLLFTANLFFMRALGATDAARDPEGKFKRLSVKSFIGFASVLGLMVGFPALGALAILPSDALSLWSAWSVAYGIYVIVNLYDFVVLDYLVIVRWHPAFLNLPDTDYYTTTRPHAEGFVEGW